MRLRSGHTSTLDTFSACGCEYVGSARTSGGIRNDLWVDLVWVVALYGGLGCGKTCDGSEAEGECGVHVGCVLRLFCEKGQRGNCEVL